MPNIPTISGAEWKIMRLLWTKSPQPAYDLIQSLQQTEGWHANTVRTMLARLNTKKAVTSTKYKNLFLYAPAISEEECIQAEGDSFLERVFGGSAAPLLLHFASNHKLSKADVQKLKRLLDNAEE